MSSLAYQGHVRGLGIEKVMDINRIAIDNIFPDKIFFLDLDPKVGLERSFDQHGDKFEA